MMSNPLRRPRFTVVTRYMWDEHVVSVHLRKQQFHEPVALSLWMNVDYSSVLYCFQIHI